MVKGNVNSLKKRKHYDVSCVEGKNLVYTASQTFRTGFLKVFEVAYSVHFLIKM